MAGAITKAKVYHLAVVIYYMISDYHIMFSAVPRMLREKTLIRENAIFLGPMFATIWVQVTTQSYFVLSLFQDVHEILSVPLNPRWKNLTSGLFTCTVFPLGITVCLNFWLILWKDRLLLDCHEVLFEYLTPPVNHILHTHVLVLVLVEQFVQYREYPEHVTTGLARILWCMLSYVVVVLVVQPYCVFWVYPYFGLMTNLQRVLYGLVNILFTFFNYYLGLMINRVVWDERQEVAKVPADANEDKFTTVRSKRERQKFA